MPLGRRVPIPRPQPETLGLRDVIEGIGDVDDGDFQGSGNVSYSIEPLPEDLAVLKRLETMLRA